MKKFLALAIIMLTAYTGFSQTYVSGYYRSNGTYVAPHYRSTANYTKADNWSTLGNINPTTGSMGTKTYTDYNNYSYYNISSSSYNYSTPSYNGSSYTLPSYSTISLPDLSNLPGISNVYGSSISSLFR